MSNETLVREFLQRMADEVEFTPPDWRPPVQRARRRRRVTIAILVCAVVAVVSAGSVAVRSFGQAQLQPATRPHPKTHQQAGPGAMVDIRTGAVTPLPATITRSNSPYYAVSPNHTHIAYSAQSPRSSRGALYVANLDGTGIRRLTPKGSLTYGAQWSPDDYTLVFQLRADASTGQLGNLFTLDVNSGRETQLTHFDQTQQWPGWFMFPSFYMNGSNIIFQLPGGDPQNPTWRNWAVLASGGTPGHLRGSTDRGWPGLAYGLADPKHDVLFLAPLNRHGLAGAALWLGSYDLRTIRPEALVQHGSISWPRWSPDGTRISYSNDGSIYVLDVATRSIKKVAVGGSAEWFDDHTLLIGSGQ
jgi:Tol biopolymer transport system component